MTIVVKSRGEIIKGQREETTTSTKFIVFLPIDLHSDVDITGNIGKS